MPTSSSPLGDTIRYAIWLAITICVFTECHRICYLSTLYTTPPNLLLRTVFYLSAPIWVLVGPPSLVVFLHIYQTPTLTITTRTRELFHEAVTFFALHICGLASQGILGGDARALAWSIGICLVWLWGVYLEMVIRGRPRIAEEWLLLPVDQQMRYEEEEEVAKLSTKTRVVPVDVQTTVEEDSSRSEEDIRGLTKKVEMPVVAQVTDKAEEDESELAEEWIRVPEDDKI